MPIKKNPVRRVPLPPAEGEAQTYVSAKDAAQALGIKTTSLYAYVSRGLVRSIVQPGKRQRLYYREDIERASRRMGGRAGIPETVEAVLSWGQPVFQTSITDIGDHGPSYRGRPAIVLAQQGRSFESVAELLWTGMDLPQLATWDAEVPVRLGERLTAATRGGGTLSALRLMGLTNALIGVSRDARPDFERGSTVADARQLMICWTGALGLLRKRPEFLDRRRTDESVAELFLRAMRSPAIPQAVHAINFALILCADHELSPATLSARIAASCGSDLRACLLAAIGTHGGTLMAGGCDQTEALLRHARDAGKMHALMAGLEKTGGRIPGYNLRAYPKGDPRARILMELAASVGPKARRIVDLVRSVEEKFDLRPSLEVGLIALAAALDLPLRGASALWSLGRSAGWVAHVIEQRQAGFMVRPRAKYVGPPVTAVT